VRAAHHTIRTRALEDPELHGMGTTIDVAMVVENQAIIAHVGDSRAYLVRDGNAVQLTRDHTMAQLAVIDGSLSADEARLSPLGSVLCNAVGCLPEVSIDVVQQTLCGGDRLVLCTDGLHDGLSTDVLASRTSATPPERALAALVGMARVRGGRDNITGVIVEVLPNTPPGWDDEPTVPRPVPFTAR